MIHANSSMIYANTPPPSLLPPSLPPSSLPPSTPPSQLRPQRDSWRTPTMLPLCYMPLALSKDQHSEINPVQQRMFQNWAAGRSVFDCGPDADESGSEESEESPKSSAKRRKIGQNSEVKSFPGLDKPKVRAKCYAAEYRLIGWRNLVCFACFAEADSSDSSEPSSSAPTQTRSARRSRRNLRRRARPRGGRFNKIPSTRDQTSPR